MSKHVLAIDQGTTSTTVMVLDAGIGVRTRATVELPQIYPQPGWVEHDPAAIWGSVVAAIEAALRQAAITATDIAAIGITNQRETAIVWDRVTGEPVHHAIVWQDRRTAPQCARMRAEGLENLYRERAGLVLDPYFSGTKVSWLLDAVDPDRKRAEDGALAFGTVDSYLIWRLTGGKVHVTDATNASRTLLLDIHDMAWSEQLAGPLGVPLQMLPAVRGCSEVYGQTRGVPGLPDGIPIAGAAGDQQAALFGQACFAEGDAKCTYGTGAFLLVNTGGKALRSQHGTLTTVGWSIGDETVYALEGSAFVAGAAVQWLRDGLGLIESAAGVESLAGQVSDSGEVVFVPALAGLGAPHWRPDARGLISGITRGTTAAHIARATLDGIACQIHDLADAMARDLGRPLTSFKVDGGAAANDLLMQIQSDLLGMPIVRPAVIETTALGSAFLAGLAAGLWPDRAAIAQTWRPERVFEPAISAEQRAIRLQRWHLAVSHCGSR